MTRMYQNEMPLRTKYYLVREGGLVIGMSRVRIPLPSNQEWAYLAWKGSYIEIFGCRHPFCFVKYYSIQKHVCDVTDSPDSLKQSAETNAEKVATTKKN